MTANKPNLIWVAAAGSEPPEFITDGRDRIDLPPAAVAKSGFYFEDPNRIIKLSGGRFKRFVDKGQPAITAGANKTGRRKRK